MAADLAAMRQNVEQLARQVASGQRQVTEEIAKLQVTEQDILNRIPIPRPDRRHRRLNTNRSGRRPPRRAGPRRHPLPRSVEKLPVSLRVPSRRGCSPAFTILIHQFTGTLVTPSA